MTNGAAALTADRHADGVKWFTLAASIEPRNVDARIGRARALLALRKADLARAEFEGVAGIDPGSAAAFAGLGEIYLRGEDGAKAVEALDKAIALKSDSAAFYRLRSQAHGAVGNMDGAREDARKASELGG
jgi:tetratricopeptide (TPR) repeat protein